MGGENRPQYISVVSHRDTELGRVLDDEVVREVVLSGLPAGKQDTGAGETVGGDRSRDEDLGQHGTTLPVPESPMCTLPPADVERPEQNEQGEEDCNMEGGNPSRKVFIEASVPAFPLERILEKQESPEGEGR